MSNPSEGSDVLFPQDSLESWITIGCSISIALSVGFFALKLLSKWVHERKFDLSDALLGASLPFTIACNATCLWATGAPVYLGHHVSIFDAVAFKAGFLVGAGVQGIAAAKAYQALFANECMYPMALGLIKFSFLALYMRLFPQRTICCFIYLCGSLVIAWVLNFMLISIFQCNPIDAFWILDLRLTSYCLPIRPLFIGVTVPNVFTDMMILTIPQYSIWTLQVGIRTRIALACTFAIGIVSIAASLVRLVQILSVNLIDIEYSITGYILWTAIELGAATVCASLTTMKPLLVIVINKSKLSSRRWSSRGITKGSTKESRNNLDLELQRSGGKGPRRQRSSISQDKQILVTSDLMVECGSRGEDT